MGMNLVMIFNVNINIKWIDAIIMKIFFHKGLFTFVDLCAKALMVA